MIFLKFHLFFKQASTRKTLYRMSVFFYPPVQNYLFVKLDWHQLNKHLTEPNRTRTDEVILNHRWTDSGNQHWDFQPQYFSWKISHQIPKNQSSRAKISRGDCSWMSARVSHVRILTSVLHHGRIWTPLHSYRNKQLHVDIFLAALNSDSTNTHVGH